MFFVGICVDLAGHKMIPVPEFPRPYLESAKEFPFLCLWMKVEEFLEFLFHQGNIRSSGRVDPELEFGTPGFKTIYDRVRI